MAREHSGSGQYLARANPTGINTSVGFTIIGSLWLDSAGVNQQFLRIGTPGATLSRGVSLYQEDNGTIGFHCSGGAGLNAGGTPPGAGAWFRYALTQSASGGASPTSILSVNGTAILTNTTDRAVALSSGDEISIGRGGDFSYYGSLDGRSAGVAYLEGVVLSAAAADTFAQDLCSLITSYGPSGSVTANALKAHYLLQSGAPGVDGSGVGNDLTDTSTTNVADPAWVPSSCSAPAANTPNTKRFGGIPFARGDSGLFVPQRF